MSIDSIDLVERPANDTRRVWCSFCGRHDGQARVMVAGDPGSAICDCCIRIASAALLQYEGEAEYQSWLTALTPNVRVEGPAR